MADTVNSQVTDSVTQSNEKVLANAPAMAMGSLYQTMAHSLGLLMENAVAAQQNMNAIAQATSVQGVNMIYAVDTAAASAATSKILNENEKQPS